MGELDRYLFPVQPLRGNPCMDCARPIMECPWLHEDKPVPGWKASPRSYSLGRRHGIPVMVTTYEIRSCPLFVPAPERYSNPAELTTAQNEFFLWKERRK